MIDTGYKVLPSKFGRILVDAEDYEWIKREYSYSVMSRPDGYMRVTCCLRRSRGPRKGLARVIMGCDDEDKVVDHINHDTLDNRKTNLRIVSRNLNNANKRPSGASLFRGISFHRERRLPFRGQLKRLGKNYYGPYRFTEEQAALDANRLVIMVWGHQVILNEVRCMSESPEPRDGNCPTCHAVCYCCCVCSDEMTPSMQRLAELMEQVVTQTAC